jgi:hypothetical protein
MQWNDQDPILVRRNALDYGRDAAHQNESDKAFAAADQEAANIPARSTTTEAGEPEPASPGKDSEKKVADQQNSGPDENVQALPRRRFIPAPGRVDKFGRRAALDFGRPPEYAIPSQQASQAPGSNDPLPRQNSQPSANPNTISENDDAQARMQLKNNNSGESMAPANDQSSETNVIESARFHLVVPPEDPGSEEDIPPQVPADSGHATQGMVDGLEIANDNEEGITYYAEDEIGMMNVKNGVDYSVTSLEADYNDGGGGEHAQRSLQLRPKKHTRVDRETPPRPHSSLQNAIGGFVRRRCDYFADTPADILPAG